MFGLKELLVKKKKEMKGDMPESHKNAKMSVLNELKDLMHNKMSGDLKGLKKVTVASDSEEGLKEGLEKAEEVLDQKEEPSEDDSMESASEEKDEENLDNCSPEELDSMIAELQAKKAQLAKK